MSEMVERVKRAIWEELSTDEGGIVVGIEEAARAAIAAMREPTRAMMRLPEGRDDWQGDVTLGIPNANL